MLVFGRSLYIDGTWNLEAHYGALCPHFDPIHLFIVDIYKGSNCSKNPATCKTGSLDSPFSRFHNWILQMLKVLLAWTLLAVLEVVSSVIASSQILQVIPKVKSYQMLSPEYGWFESLYHSYTVTRLRSHAMINWPNSVAHHMKLWLLGSQSLQPKGCNCSICSMYSGPQIWSSRPLRTLLHLTIILPLPASITRKTLQFLPLQSFGFFTPCSSCSLFSDFLASPDFIPPRSAFGVPGILRPGSPTLLCSGT